MERSPARILLAATLLAAAVTAPAFAQPVPAPVIDNARVTVRDVPLAAGIPAPAIEHAGDYVILFEKGGRIRDAAGHVATHADGSAVFGHGGRTADTAVGADAHEVIVDLKEAPSNTVPNTTGLPDAFPRPGARLIAENSKVRVWNYRWEPGHPSAMHFHNTEVVVIYLGNGDLTAVAPDGSRTVNHRKPGDIVYNLANRSHSEEVTSGEQSGIMLELK